MTPRLTATVPFLACEDIVSTISFYKTKLGFHQDWTWGEPPTDAGMSRDSVSVYLTENPDLAFRIAGSEIVFQVDDIDALYAEHSNSNAPIASPLSTKPWGVREYSVQDPAGYILRFSGR
jgi:uncharacterized glyoxalase superfamily protein PhnB